METQAHAPEAEPAGESHLEPRHLAYSWGLALPLPWRRGGRWASLGLWHHRYWVSGHSLMHARRVLGTQVVTNTPFEDLYFRKIKEVTHRYLPIVVVLAIYLALGLYGQIAHPATENDNIELVLVMLLIGAISSLWWFKPVTIRYALAANQAGVPLYYNKHSQDRFEAFFSQLTSAYHEYMVDRFGFGQPGQGFASQVRQIDWLRQRGVIDEQGYKLLLKLAVEKMPGPALKIYLHPN